MNTKKITRFLSLVLATIMCIVSLSFTVTAGESASESVPVSDKTSGEVAEVVDKEVDFEDNIVLVRFKKEYSDPNVEVTSEAFPELDVKEVKNYKIAASDENFVRDVSIVLAEHSKEGVLVACELLSQREDIVFATPSYIFDIIFDQFESDDDTASEPEWYVYDNYIYYNYYDDSYEGGVKEEGYAIDSVLLRVKEEYWEKYSELTPEDFPEIKDKIKNITIISITGVDACLKLCLECEEDENSIPVYTKELIDEYIGIIKYIEALDFVVFCYPNYYVSVDAVLPAPCTLLGDVNFDGYINMKDVLLVRKHVARIIELTPDQVIAADIETDGIINMKDILFLRTIVAGRPYFWID